MRGLDGQPWPPALESNHALFAPGDFLCVCIEQLWTTLNNFELRKSVDVCGYLWFWFWSCWSSFSIFSFAGAIWMCGRAEVPQPDASNHEDSLQKGLDSHIYIKYNISYRSCIGWSEWLFRWIRCRNWRCPDQIEQWVAQDATLDQAWISTKRGLADLLILPTCDILWYHDAMPMQHSFRHWSERAGGWCDSS